MENIYQCLFDLMRWKQRFFRLEARFLYANTENAFWLSCPAVLITPRCNAGQNIAHRLQ